MESFGLDRSLAVQPEATLPTMFLGVLMRRQLRAFRLREEKQLSISENSVNIEENQFDFPGAGLGVGHGRIVTKSVVGSRSSVVGLSI
jgi:hypothetical protein